MARFCARSFPKPYEMGGSRLQRQQIISEVKKLSQGFTEHNSLGTRVPSQKNTHVDHFYFSK